MLNKWNRQGLKGRVEIPRGQDLLTVVLLRIGLRFKTSLGSRIGCPIKFLLSYLRLGMIGCLTLILISEGILVHQQRSQLVESVARITIVIVLREHIIVLVVVKVRTRLGIALILGVKTRVVVKLKQVVLKRLRKIISSMFSPLEVRRRFLQMW